MEANISVNEEPYEVKLDNHGSLDGPKTGRLRILNNVRTLICPYIKECFLGIYFLVTILIHTY